MVYNNMTPNKTDIGDNPTLNDVTNNNHGKYKIKVC